MRVVFFGSGEFGLPTLDWLREYHTLAGIVTQPDKPAGRKRRVTPTPIGQWAAEHGIEPIKTNDCNDPQLLQSVHELQPEVGIVIAFGQKLGQALVGSLGRLGVNLHGSLLPKYRGAAPVNWAVISDERETGVSVIELAQRMDAGRILAQATLAIDPLETAGEVHDRLAELGPGVLERVLGDLERGELRGIEQQERQASKAPKLTKADGTVDFARPARAVRAWIHGLTPWPGCRVHWHCRQTDRTQPLMLLRAEVLDGAGSPDGGATDKQPPPGTVVGEDAVLAGDGALVRLRSVQPPGKRSMTMADFVRGYPFGAGDRLTPIWDSQQATTSA